MFLGLEGPAKDHTKFFEPTERALFIQESTSCWRYFGLYVIQRHECNDLTVEEWAAFNESVRFLGFMTLGRMKIDWMGVL